MVLFLKLSIEIKCKRQRPNHLTWQYPFLLVYNRYKQPPGNLLSAVRKTRTGYHPDRNIYIPDCSFYHKYLDLMLLERLILQHKCLIFCQLCGSVHPVFCLFRFLILTDRNNSFSMFFAASPVLSECSDLYAVNVSIIKWYDGITLAVMAAEFRFL